MPNPPPRIRSTPKDGPLRHLEKLKPLAQIALRLALAIVFFSHGYPKLFTRHAQFMGLFPKLGFPAYFVYLSGSVEVFGSFLLVVGLFTRLVALLLAGEMAIVLWKVMLPKGLLPVANYQLELVLAVAAFTLLVIGPGAVSADRLFFRSKS